VAQRVADAKRALQVFGGGGGFHFRHAADTAYAADGIAGMHGDTGGIITAVFQALEAIYQNGNYIARRNGANDATHYFLLALSLPAGAQISVMPLA
jgi:hypothetical protein